MKKYKVFGRVLAVCLCALMMMAVVGCGGEKDTSLKNISVVVNYGERDKVEQSFSISTRASFGIDALNDLSQSTEHVDTTGEYPVYTYDFSFGGTWSVTGLFIETVNGVKADGATQEWWKILVNGEMSMRGISSLKIKNDDKISLVLVKGYN